jgi:cell division protein ZapA (FtsZ GTPase activity inhibitor)
MGQAESISVKIGRTTLQVPVHINEDETHRIVDRLNRRLEQIEAASGRIDSQAFAALAAYEFAVETETAREECRSEEKEIAVALDRLNQELKRILKLLG